MPIPALNSIANQARVLYSGRSVSAPSRIRPHRVAASTMTATSTIVAVSR
nr:MULTISPECIES: hypothetical protein [unclassified Blastococcus]